MTPPFLVVGFESSVSCFLSLVHQMDKVELSERERDVLSLLAQRMTDKEIAKALTISPLTVKRHATNIYGKLQVSGRREAVAKAIRLGLL